MEQSIEKPTGAQYTVIVTLASRLAFAATGVVNISLVKKWAAKITITDADAIRVAKPRMVSLSTDKPIKYGSAYTIVPLEVFCAVLLLELDPPLNDLSRDNSKLPIVISGKLIAAVEQKLDYYGQQGVLFDCTDPYAMSMEAQMVMWAIQMYSEHARKSGFTISTSHLAEVWTASLRALWKCRYNQKLWKVSNQFALTYGRSEHPIDAEAKARDAMGLVVAIVERMIAAIVSIRYGLSFKLKGVTLGDSKETPFAEMVVGGDDPRRDILSYVLNSKCALEVTLRHMITSDSMSSSFTAVFDQFMNNFRLATIPNITSYEGTSQEDHEFISTRPTAQSASSSSTSAAAAASH